MRCTSTETEIMSIDFFFTQLMLIESFKPRDKGPPNRVFGRQRPNEEVVNTWRKQTMFPQWTLKQSDFGFSEVNFFFLVESKLWSDALLVSASNTQFYCFPFSFLISFWNKREIIITKLYNKQWVVCSNKQ
jgi:hypothetical protein